MQTLGCRWLTDADRNGTIGPFPEHCAKTVELNVQAFAALHARFTALARTQQGRYYGWTVRPHV